MNFGIASPQHANSLRWTGQVISVFSGSCGSLTSVACGKTGFSGGASFETTPGTDYFILVGITRQSYNTPFFLPGDITYSFSLTSAVYPPPPTNDTCASADLISSLPFQANPVVAPRRMKQ